MAATPNLDRRLVAFLDMLAGSEGTSTSAVTRNSGYDVIVSGVAGPEAFTDYSDHPFAKGRPAKLIRPATTTAPTLTSTASGRYQLLLRYWRAYQRQLHLPDFSPASQDAVALQQIKERGAVADILAGEVELAIGLCSNIWASLPGNNYEQPGGKTMAELTEDYQALLSV